LRSLATAQPIELRVSGGSMLPTLTADESVTIVPARRYWPGDIVVFRNHAGNLVAHRLLGPIRTRAGVWGWVAQGDAVDTADGIFAKSEILGRIIAAASRRQALSPSAFTRLRSLARWVRYVAWRLSA